MIIGHTKINSRFFEIAFVLVYLDQFASRIVNVDHGIMRAALVFRVAIASATFKYHSPLNGSASEIRSKPR